MNKIIPVTILAIVLVGFGTLGGLYTQTWDPLWNPFRPDPDIIITDMGSQIGQVETSAVNVDFEFDFHNGQEFTINGIISARENLKDFDNPETEGEFDFSFKTEGLEMSFAGAVIDVGEDSYWKFTTIPASSFIEPYFALFGIEIEDIKNEWIKVDGESLKELMGEDYDSTKELEEHNKEIIEEVKDILEKAILFKVREELEDEVLDNVKTYHYLVYLDKQGIKLFVPELMEAMAKYYPELSLNEEGMEESMQEFEKTVDEFFAKTGGIEAEIWIGKKDHLPYKIVFEKEIDISQIDESEEGIVKIKINADFSRFNQLMEIEAPSDYKILDEIIQIPSWSY